MKILYHIPYPLGLGDDRTIYDGYKFAFEDLGHEVVTLTEKDDLEKTLITVRPDIFITALAIIDPKKNAQVLKSYRQRGGKVLMKAGWIDKDDKELVRLIREDYLGDAYVSELEAPHFEKLTGKIQHVLQLAASRQYHFPVPPQKKYQCDIIFIGANLTKKRDLFQRRLLPLFKKYNVKVFGTGWDWIDKYFLWPLSKLERLTFSTGFFGAWRNSRQVPWQEENAAYSSAKICLNFHEQQPGDVMLLNGRTFKIPACGGFEICDYVSLARKYFNEDELVMVKNDEDFFNKIDYYLTHNQERKAIQEKGTAKVLKEHMYHNRVNQVFKILNFNF